MFRKIASLPPQPLPANIGYPPGYYPSVPEFPGIEPDVEEKRRSAVGFAAHVALGTTWGRRVTGVLTVATMGVGFWASNPDTASQGGHDTCTDRGHQLVEIGDTGHLPIPGLGITKLSIRSTLRNIPFSHLAEDNRSWSELARNLSRHDGAIGRGYDISPTSLAMNNASLATYVHGKLSPNISFNGEACATLPAPLIPGFVAVDGHQSINDYHIAYKVDVSKLKKLNPGVSGNPKQVMRAGEILKVSSPDTSFVWREMSEKKQADAITSTAMSRKISDINPLGATVAPGKSSFLPFTQTPAMEKHGITTDDVMAEYKDSYAQMSGVQTVAPKRFKPVTPIKPRQESKNTIAADNLTLLRMEVSGIRDEYARLILKYQRMYLPDISPFILAAQIIEESSGNGDTPDSEKGARGLTQIMPETFKEIAKALGWPADASPLNPRYAIEGQAYYMRQMMDHAKPFVGKYTQLPLALAAYNDGPWSLDKWGGMPPASEIANYPWDIIARAQRMAAKLPPLKITGATHATSTGQIVPESVDGKPYFSQTDLRWNRYRYNTNYTTEYNIGLNGCELGTASAEVSEITGLYVSPPDIAEFNMANGYVIPDKNEGGSDGEASFRALAVLLGKKVITFSHTLSPELITYLKQGHEAMFNGQDNDPSTPATSGAHVMGLRGITPDGKLLILDPASIYNTRQTWTAQQTLGTILDGGYLLGMI